MIQKSEAKTEMVAPKSSTKMVRVRAMRSVIDHDEVIHNPGEEFETTEAWANQICRPGKGQYDFSGERSTQSATHWDTTRAVRV